MQRLEDEYDAQVLITTPSVPYKLKLTENSPTAKLHGNHEVEITNPSKWPAVNEVKAYYEPVHGSAPDIAGTGTANPFSMIGSVALMLDRSFGLQSESQAVWDALWGALEAGERTADLCGDNETPLSTSEFGDAVVARLTP